MARGGLSTELRARFDPVAVVLSPPRSGSTVLARSLWQHGMFRYYLHEPFDRVYHEGSAASLETMLGSVLDRGAVRAGGPYGGGIVVKEMTFQAGQDAPELLDAATVPVVLLVRDPRLAVSSRMRCREADGEDPRFPCREAGWQDLAVIRDTLGRRKADYAVVDISDVRRRPAEVLAAVCVRLGLPWDNGMLSWEADSGIQLGQLNGSQDRWYERVLASTGFEPPDEPVPGVGYFRARKMLDVVTECLASYRQVRSDSRFIDVGSPFLESAAAW